ncbi:MAG: adenylyltransferase/cytidyltransferase family protein [Patescibacteria group bacterium]
MSKTTIKNLFSFNSDVKTRYVQNHEELKKTIDLCKKMGYRIVLTQGVFDLIHEGHANYLEKARAYGDMLIVGIDSDELTRKRKGPNRPIVPQSERIRMLSHLRHVDIIALRDLDHDIGHLIRVIEPDVLVVSETTKDFGKKLQMEYKPFCKKIVILPAQGTAHTSARIRNLTIEGAEQLATEISKITQDFIKKIRNAK